MIAIFDLGIGNLSSVQSGFARAGANTEIVGRASEYRELVQAHRGHLEGVVLPGVGAFGDAMFQLRATGLHQIVREVVQEELPLLGICLGMQLLFSRSEEHGAHIGLGCLPGAVVRFQGNVKIPHMGWNTISVVHPHPLLEGISTEEYVYFVHSYYAVLQDQQYLLAATTYADVVVPAVVGKGNVFGAQFHPEKSGPVGERILRNFVRYTRATCTAKEQ